MMLSESFKQRAKSDEIKIMFKNGQTQNLHDVVLTEYNKEENSLFVRMKKDFTTIYHADMFQVVSIAFIDKK